MSRVRIVTDSNAYLTPEVLEKHRIQVIPHHLRVGGATYEEGQTFQVDQLFRRLQDTQTRGDNHLPDIVGPDFSTILECYQRLGKESEHIVSIHMSSELSPMWQQARRAAEMLKGRHTIRVIDSLSTSYGLGILVEKAARAADEGASVNEVARIVNGAIPHLYLAVFSESLNFLERSARLGASQSLLGTMLGIKAMLMMEEGRLISLEKVQTRDDVVDKLFEFVAEFARVEAVGLFHHAYEQPQRDLLARLRELLPRARFELLTYPPSLATYVGPNALGVIVYEGTM